MTREEVLEKSRTENRNQDMFENEVLRAAGNAAAIAAFCLATIFFALQIFAGGGSNYALYAIAFVILATTFTVKAVRLRRRHEILLAAAYWVFVITFSFAHIFQLFTTATA
ncbi:MAG: hypothetical protein HDR02_07365 [Lachnospiraceae bacterium]|nr:hypothetical protein [Lachnospiraceae bacterium]